MKSITIRDAEPNRPFLSFDLTDLLDVVGADRALPDRIRIWKFVTVAI